AGIRQDAAALRDCDPAYDRSGSSATHAVEATCPCLSASPRKRPTPCVISNCREVPQADSCTAAKQPLICPLTLRLLADARRSDPPKLLTQQPHRRNTMCRALPPRPSV